jgi:hypothetical protein
VPVGVLLLVVALLRVDDEPAGGDDGIRVAADVPVPGGGRLQRRPDVLGQVLGGLEVVVPCYRVAVCGGDVMAPDAETIIDADLDAILADPALTDLKDGPAKEFLTRLSVELDYDDGPPPVLLVRR